MADIVTKSVADKPLQWLAVVGVVGVGGYFLFNKLNKSKEEKIQEKSETSDSPENPFSYNTFLAQKGIPDGASMLTWSSANSYAKQIYESLNTYFDDSEDVCIGAFKALSSKLKVAQVARNFYGIYKRDILEYLKAGNKTFGFGTGGLGESDYQQILTIVNNKPKY
jgi:hypothetical protein